MLLIKRSYIRNQLELPHVLEYMVHSNMLSSEKADRIKKEECRLTRIDLFLKEIIQDFDVSTYQSLKRALESQNSQILRELELEEKKLRTRKFPMN